MKIMWITTEEITRHMAEIGYYCPNFMTRKRN
jgi:hypothetical protein